MPGSIRPWVAAGVAVVVTGVIAVAPFEPAPSGHDIRIATSALEIITTPSPLDFYPQVVMRSLENAGDLLSEYLAAPLPIVKAMGDSQLAALVDIADAADRGDVVAVVTAVLQAIATPVANLMKVAATGEPFRMTASLIVRLALPIVSSVLAAGSAAGDVVEALVDVDFVSALSGLTNIPARIADGFLNGRVDAASDEYFGLLTLVRRAPVAEQLTGPIAFLIDSIQQIGDTISPPAPQALGAGPVVLPEMGAATVTLPTSPSPPSEATPPTNGPADEPALPATEPNDPPAGSGDEPAQNEDTTDTSPDSGGRFGEETDAAPTEPPTAPGTRSDASPAPSDSDPSRDDGDSGGDSPGGGTDDSPGGGTDDSTSGGTDDSTSGSGSGQ